MSYTDPYDGDAFELRGWKVVVERDPYPEDPRDWDGSFLWLGFPHRNYTFGDEQVDDLEELHVPCGTCDGTGKLPTGDCALCDGDGWYHPRSLQEACETLAAEHGALHWEPVWMTDHSICHYSVGGGPPDRWDSGCAGIILVTAEMAEAWGCNPENDPAEWRRQMAAEIEQYDAYVNGEVWEFKVYDRDGNDIEVDSFACYDFDEAVKAATASVPAEEAPPATPPPVYVTVPPAQIERIQAWLDQRAVMQDAEDRGVADADDWHYSDDEGCDIAQWLADQLNLTAAELYPDTDEEDTDE